MLDQVKLQNWNTPANAVTAHEPNGGYAGGPWAAACPSMSAPLYSIEGDAHYRLWFFLPSLDPETMTLSAQGATISIRASQITPKIADDENMVIGKLPVGENWWSLRLPFEVTDGQVEAAYHHGFLELTVAKKSEHEHTVPIPLKAA